MHEHLKHRLVMTPSARTPMNQAVARPAPGNPTALPENLRATMESSFGADFAAVRIHEGSHARSLGARAVARGSDIHFAPSAYQPQTRAGRELLGHELAHVVQQAQGRVRADSLGINRDPALEHEAAQQGARAARGDNAGTGAYVSASSAGSGAVAQLANDPALEVVNYLSMIDMDAAAKHNILKLPQFGQERSLLALFLGVPISITTSNPRSNEAEDMAPLTLAIASWQYDYLNAPPGSYQHPSKGDFTKVTGKYGDAKAALFVNGFDPTGKTKDWAKQDHSDAAHVLAQEQEQLAVVREDSSTQSKRQAIVDLAYSQVGTVVTIDRGDGSQDRPGGKIGWERIARYYEVAQQDVNGLDQFKRKRDQDGVPIDAPIGKIGDSKLVGIRMANKYANNKTGDWSWCGIFTMWAIRSVTGKGSWDGGPKGVGSMKDDLHNARRGDIIAIKPTSNPNNHHILLADEIPLGSKPGDTISTIEGNIDVQGIKATRRWKISDVSGYYSTVP
jgi:hypothetical protein